MPAIFKNKLYLLLVVVLIVSGIFLAYLFIKNQQIESIKNLSDPSMPGFFPKTYSTMSLDAKWQLNYFQPIYLGSEIDENGWSVLKTAYADGVTLRHVDVFIEGKIQADKLTKAFLQQDSSVQGKLIEGKNIANELRKNDRINIAYLSITHIGSEEKTNLLCDELEHFCELGILADRYDIDLTKSSIDKIFTQKNLVLPAFYISKELVNE